MRSHQEYLDQRLLKSKKMTKPHWRLLMARRSAMIHRCYNKNHKSYSRYGGRSIGVCHEWLVSPESFYEWAISKGFKVELQMDRLDNNGPYSPENCHWTTNQENSLNTEKAIKIDIDGQIYRTKEMKQILGVCQQLISRWNKRGVLEQKLILKLKEI